jgi:glycosyltransferase involved in cell wall biosynthesis
VTVSLSIITVCLNNKSGLDRTAKSIIQQTHQDFEWIVVDGYSTDGTVDLFELYSGKIDHLISEPDDGIYDAMNKGIALATGKYCLFLNAGDTLFDSEVVQRLCPYLVGDLIIGQMEVYHPVNTRKNGIRIFSNRKIGKRYLFYRTLPHQGTCIKKSLFDEYGGYDTSFVIAADHDFFMRVFNSKIKISFVPFCLSRYMLDGLSTQLKTSKLLDAERNKIRKRHFSILYRLWRKLIRILESSVKTIVSSK